MGRPALHWDVVGDTHHLSPLVVIAELDIVDITVFEPEADTPLVVDRDRVLPLAVAFKRVQPVARWDPEILDPCGRIDLLELAHGPLRHIRWHAARLAGQV